MATIYTERAVVDSNVAGTRHDVVALLARVLLVAMFLVSGFDKATGFTGTVSYIAGNGLPFPEVAATIAVTVELGLGLLVFLGWKSRWPALMIAIYTIAAGLLFHAYWNDAPANRMDDYINFWKNVSIAGGFLMIFAFGPGRYSIDRG